MLDLIPLLLATFWVWETVRYAAERYAETVFDATRAVHPLLVAALPLVVLWPDWVDALAVAAGVGLLHLFVQRALGLASPPQVVMQRPRRGGLPPLPR